MFFYKYVIIFCIERLSRMLGKQITSTKVPFEILLYSVQFKTELLSTLFA